jgi:hypothetical protein
MAHNPMIEIVLEHALNVLTDAETVVETEIVSLTFVILNMEKAMPKGEQAVQHRERLDKYLKLQQDIQKVLRQGNGLNL